MSIEPLKRKDGAPGGGIRFDGWQVRLRGYPRMENNELSRRLLPIKKNFPESKGYRRKDAERFERDELSKRDAIERERRLNPDRPIPAQATDRTLEELVAYYYTHEDFRELAIASHLKIRSALAEFLEWNQKYGRPYARDWTEELARKRIDYLRYEYRPARKTAPSSGGDKDGRHDKDGRRGQGAMFHAIYNKKIFALESARADTSLAKNPWPKLRDRKSRAVRRNPRPYTREELRALFAVMEPYERLLFGFLYGTGCRSEELLKLKKSHITTEQGQPVAVTFVKTKTYAERAVPLSGEARDAVTGLLAAADDTPADDRSSAFLVRSEFLHTAHGNRIRTPLLDALERIKRRAVKHEPGFQNAFFGRVDEDDPRSRMITNVHTFRSTFVTELLLGGVNVVSIAQLIGDRVETLLKHYAGILNQDHLVAVLKLPSIETNFLERISA